jgi:peptide/nickel transport system substrate-binding protein
MAVGTEDLPMDTPVNPPSIPGLASSKAPSFQVWPSSNTHPYLVFNLRSPDADGAVQKLLVRQAIEYGLDKAAVVKAAGGPLVGKIINTAIPPGNAGYEDYNLYPDDNGSGDPALCRQYLARAGYPHGLTLTYMYLNDSPNFRILSAVQASLAQCGITLAGKPEAGSSFFTDLGDSPENNKPGSWDIGQVGRLPDWFGNNGRTIIQALFQGPDCVVNTVNFGCYDNAAVNADIKLAEAATSTGASVTDWHAADVQIMKDAAIVPIMSQNWAVYASSRVRGVGFRTAIFTPNIGGVDITNIWLSGS